MDLRDERQFLRALGVFAEGVRRAPEDHRSRMLAARCLVELGERERALLVLHTCAEGLLRRDFLLSAMAACHQALKINPQERMVRETLLKIHARAVKTGPGRPAVPPPLPPQGVEGGGEQDLMGLSGSELADRAMEVLLQPDPRRIAEPLSRPPLPLFAELAAETLLELLPLLEYRQVPAGTVLSVAGQPAESMFVLVAGKAEVSVLNDGHETTVGFLGGGSMFGEISLLTRTLPGATVTSSVETELFVIPRKALSAFVSVHPEVAEVLADFGQQRLARTLLQSSPLFAVLPPESRPELLENFEYRTLKTGERAVVEGQPSPGLFLVLSGELTLGKKDEVGTIQVGRLREVSVAGEISLLSDVPATATVTASQETAVAFIARASFVQQLERFPQMREYLTQLSERRLLELRRFLRPAEILDADGLVVDEAR